MCKARIIRPSHFVDKQTKETQGTLRSAQGHTAAIVSVEPTLLLKFDFLMTALVSIAARRLSLIAVSGASL